MFDWNTSLLSQYPKLGGPHAVYLADDDAGAGGPAEDGEPKSDDDKGGQPEAVVPKAELDRAIADAKKYRERAQKAEKAHADQAGRVMSDEDREEYEALKQQKAQAEEDRQRQEGKFDELLAAKQAKADEAIEAERKRADAAVGLAKQYAVTQPMLVSLAKAGVKDAEAAAHLIQNLYSMRATAVVNEDGSATVQVVETATGKPVVDAECKAGETIGIDTLVQKFLATDRGKHFLPPSGDTGSGAHRGGAPGVTIAELDADPEKKVEFIQKHGSAAYQKLARTARRGTGK